jgi:CRP-like cAMP-binding protein
MPNPGAMSVLRGNPIFKDLPEDLLAEIAELCENQSYRRNETVFAEGTPGTKLYGVIAGRLLITTSSLDGRDLHLNVVVQGEIVGEIAFLDGGMRTATGRAVDGPVTCFEIDRAPFFKLLERTPLLSVHLLQLVCRRVRWMTRLVADSAFLSVPQRLATRMLDLAKPLGSGTESAEIKISQAELAEFLGISRQVVNSYLRAWQRDGRVQLARGKILIKDLSRLL